MMIHTTKAREVPFFDKCLSNDCKEKQENTIRLPEEEPELVERFLKLVLYHKDTKFDPLQPIYVYPPDAGSMLVRLFVLADKLDAEAQQNKVMDLLRANLYIHGFEKSLETLLHAGLENSKLFDMLTTQLAWEMKWHVWWEIIESHPDFNDWLQKGGLAVREVVRKSMEARSLEPQSLTVDDWALPEVLCKWHSHNSTPPCVLSVQAGGRKTFEG